MVKRDKINRLLYIATVTLLAATLAGFAGEYWWFLDLFVHFRVHYLAGASLLLLGFIATRGLAGGALGLVCLVLNGLPVISFFAQAGTDDVVHGEILKVVSANVGGSGGANSAQIAAFIRDARPDVLLLIELTPPILTKLQDVLDDTYPHRYAVPRSDYFGIGVFSRYPLQDRKLLDLGYRQVPALSARVVVERTAVRFVGVHLEWPMTPSTAAGRNTQLHNLALSLKNVGDATILLGDFNLTRWGSHFDELLTATGLRDSATGFGWLPTWPTFLPRVGITIDHCLASPSLRVHSYRRGPDIGSDHYPLIVEAAL